MARQCELKLEFGDFETSSGFFQHDKCVEFPLSWGLRKQNNGNIDVAKKDDLNEPAVEKAGKVDSDISVPLIVAGTEKVEKSIDVDVTKRSEGNELKGNNTDSIAEKKNPVDITFSQDLPDSVVNGNITEPEHFNVEVNGIEPNKEDGKDVEIHTVNGDVDVKEKPSESMKPLNSWAGLFRSKMNSVPSGTLDNTLSEMEKNISSDDKNDSLELEKQPDTDATSNEVNDAPAESVKEVKVSEDSILKPENDPHAKVLAEAFSNLELKYKPQAFIPRGLVNSSNWCYINATLQALMMCPPFFQLLKSLPQLDEKNSRSSTPVINCFIQLASEFCPLSTKKGYQLSKEIRQGYPFAPDCVYNMLASMKSSLSDTGSQEDAEEFLACVLNGLHEEMIALSNLDGDEDVASGKKSESRKDSNQSDGSPFIEKYPEEEEEWEEVIGSKKNKSAVTRRADNTKTLISEIFRGELCSSVSRFGQKQSISHEPFFSLPIAVPTHDQYWSVEDALYALTSKENIYNSEKGQNISRQQFIETLPPILILHLKRFVYNQNGGPMKLDRRMDFRSDLVIAKELLSKSSRKYSLAQRTYKLFAVVCHHGDRSSGGHYTADVFHIGVSSWLRIDDQKIHAVSHSEVTRHGPNRSPYLLFYRRTDLG